MKNPIRKKLKVIGFINQTPLRTLRFLVTGEKTFEQMLPESIRQSHDIVLEYDYETTEIVHIYKLRK